MEQYKVYFRIKGEDCVNIYYTNASCEQEAIWQWKASVFTKIYECKFLGVELASK